LPENGRLSTRPCEELRNTKQSSPGLPTVTARNEAAQKCSIDMISLTGNAGQIPRRKFPKDFWDNASFHWVQFKMLHHAAGVAQCHQVKE
jgi:hypothetical protein